MSKRLRGHSEPPRRCHLHLLLSSRLVFDHLASGSLFHIFEPLALVSAPSTIPFATHNTLDTCFILNHVFAYYIINCAIIALSEYCTLGSPVCGSTFDVVSFSAVIKTYKVAQQRNGISDFHMSRTLGITELY